MIKSLHIACCLLFFASAATGSEPVAQDPYEEFILFAVQDAETREVKENIEIRVTKEGEDHCRWIENRVKVNGDRDDFDVVFERDTLKPVTYRRIIKTGHTTRTIRLAIGEKKIAADITDSGGNEEKQSIDLPEHGFIIEPFLKKHIALQVGIEKKAGSFTMVTFIRDKLTDFGIEWEVLERETVTTKKGDFDCQKLKIGSTSWVVRAFAPPGTTWFDTAGTNKVVRSRGQRTRFDDETITDLVDYRQGS